MDYKKWTKKIEETNGKLENNFEDLLETCKDIKKIVLTTYGLTSICLTIDSIYNLYISYGNPELQMKLQIKDKNIYLTDDLDFLDELEDDRLFYDFILNWNQTKVLYEEQLEKFLTEWFNEN